MLTSLKKILLSFFLTPLLIFFSPYLVLIKAISLLVLFDIVTGIAAARKEHKDIKSRSFFRKIPQLALFFVALAAAQVSNPLLLEFSLETHQAGKWLCGLYGVYELLSILENLGRLGLPVADKFAEMLKAKINDK